MLILAEFLQGSMPPFSRELKEEGACIKTFKVVENGIFNEDGITELLQAPGKIVRNPGETVISGTRLLSDNLSDLKAQVAANQRGIDLLLEMVEHYSLEVCLVCTGLHAPYPKQCGRSGAEYAQKSF